MNNQSPNPNYQTNSNYQIPNTRLRNFGIGYCILFGYWILVIGVLSVYAEDVKQPISVNGDTVEYLTKEKKISASGNVVVIYQDSKLTCDKLEVSTETKEGTASGNVVLSYKDTVMRGDNINYNFDTKTGKIVNADIDAPPIYARGNTIEKDKDKATIGGGYVTTCDLCKPHYRLIAKQIEFYPQEKIVAKNIKVFAGDMPVFYFPRYVHYLKTDKTVHFSFVPGSSKDWGTFILTKTRFNLSENVRARLYLDYRTRRGVAEGAGVNYDFGQYGIGDFKGYYMNEQIPEANAGETDERQRFLLRFRHKTQLANTDIVSEFHRTSDKDMLKDYFYREYTDDVKPKSYIYVSHNFLPISSNLSALYLKRTNHFYDEVEKLPELKFQTTDQPLFDSPIYFKNISTFSNFTHKFPSPTDVDYTQVRCDILNRVSIPFKAGFLELIPYGGSRETFFKRNIEGDGLNPRTTVIAGLDVSTKLFKVYDFTTNYLGLDINKLRHIITPVMAFSYTHEPTIPPFKLRDFDDIDSVGESKKVGIELVNKLQTKTKSNTARDLFIFRIDTGYIFKDYYEGGGKLADLFFDLELYPFDWLFFQTKAKYNTDLSAFQSVDIDLDMNKKNWSYLIGHRYERSVGKQMISSLRYRLNPLWEFRAYHRFEFSRSGLDTHGEPTYGLREQEYGISRDLHCWKLSLTYNVKKEGGHAIWFALTSKAFPEAELSMDATYSGPRNETPKI